MRAVLLTLSAPLRSWGGATVGDARPSEWAPTQSAIIGLVGAMVGLRRGDPAVADFYAGYDVWAVSGPKRRPMTTEDTALPRGPEVGGMAYDFQTIAHSVGGDGKVRADSIVSRRGYLSDWLDVVAVVPTDRAPVSADVIATRATSPSFPLYLGRKAFPLGDDVAATLLEDTPEALARHLWHRWVEAGGDSSRGQLWTPAGQLAHLDGFRAQRDRRCDVRGHYGFSERTVNIWRPFQRPSPASLEQSAFERVMPGDPLVTVERDFFDRAWEPSYD